MAEVAAAVRDFVVGGREWDDLLGGVRDALRIVPPAYHWSLLGLPWQRIPPRPWHSEFRMLSPWHPVRAVTYLSDVTVPSVAGEPAYLPPVVQRLFWHPSRVLQRPDHIESYTSHLDEAWFLVNGILTNDAVAHLNAAYLAFLFHRPIVLIENSTGGIVDDLVECARDKAWGHTGEAATKAFPPIYDALKDPSKTRVLVVAHSQGTIILSVVLRFLRVVTEGALPRALLRRAPTVPLDEIPLDPADFVPLLPHEVGKLEVYCFANCATQMRYVTEGAGGPVPWIESFGNTCDIVARLGVLAPNPKRWSVEIDGPRYARAAWGHLLNEHYLSPIDRAQRTGRRRGPRTHTADPFVLVNADEFPDAPVPRIYRYLNGGSPPPR